MAEQGRKDTQKSTIFNLRNTLGALQSTCDKVWIPTGPSFITGNEDNLQ